jgi:hypothetical protein
MGREEGVRGAQSKLARFRTSVAQQTGLPDEQRPTWRSWRGEAMAAAAKARIMEYCMLMDWGWWLVWVVEVFVGSSRCCELMM